MEKDLPKNWALPKLKQIVKYQKGKKPKILNEEEFDGSVPYLDIKAFEKDEVRRYADVESSTLIEKDEIGIVWDGARSGWVSKNKAGAVGSTIAILKPVGVNSELLYRFLESKFDYLNTNTRGIGIPHVDPNVLWDIDFPLPPLPEQTRIVSKLDKLFGQLEQIKEGLDKIPQLLKDFRQQILTQAVTEKLTEEWRSEKRLSEWIESSIGENSELVTKGSSPKWQGINYVEEYNKDSILFITSENVDRFNIIEGKFKYLEIGFNEKQKRSILNVGDVLTNIVGGSIGRTCIWNYNFRANINQAVCLIRPNQKKINSNFLAIYLNSDKGLTSLFSDVVDVARANISLANIRNTSINLPSIEEQQEIVNRVETLFSKADTIEQQYQALKQKIDTLPQAILHKAFKGEIVPQLESDGDARELLEEIKALKKQTAKPIGKKKNVRVSAVEPLKKSKVYRVDDVELGRVAEEGS